MKLTLTEFKQITTGAVRIEEGSNGVYFRRFTEEQEELYNITNQSFYMKTFASSGMRLSFKTNSENLFMKFKVFSATTRSYFSVDVFVNDKPIGYIDNFSDVKLDLDYTKQDFPLGEFSKEFDLGKGDKNVRIYLPWSLGIFIEELSIDDGAYIEGVKPEKKVLVFGDSITQGYDALRPSNRYMTKITDRLNLEEFNKAIGGEKYFPKLSKLKDSFAPDYIIVSYGSNDWRRLDEETFKNNCREFYKNLLNNYPDSKLIVITPIWRKDFREEYQFGLFENVEKDIREIVSEFGNIPVISGFDFVPKNEKFFADLRLHPNDEGFCYHTDNLYKEIIKYI